MLDSEDLAVLIFSAGGPETWKYVFILYVLIYISTYFNI